MDTGFEELLNKIRQDRLPAYGSVAWDGQERQVTTTVQFDGSGRESDEVIKARALKYLEGLTPEEWAAAKVEVFSKEGKPVRAVIKAGTRELSPERLQELSIRAGLKK